MIAGVLTASELSYLRTHPQRTDIFLAIPTYSVIYTARVNGTPADTDGLYEIDFDGGAGTLTDVDAGMTMLVGSAAGLSDIGIARIRKNAALGDTLFSIGTTSEIDFSDNQYITITNEFGLWPKHPYIDPATGTAYMDQDIAYTNQHLYFDPVPVMGPHAVAELTGASVTIPWTASGSYSCADSASVLTYAWTCSGATVATPASSATNITFTSAGTYLVRLVLTATYAAGPATKTTTAYRYVIIYNSDHPLIKAPILESCEGDHSTGDWSYRVTLHSQADTATIRNRVLCLLVAEDWYGDTKISIGPIAGRENIICAGWIYGESITRSNDTGDVSFEVHGPTFWLDNMQGYPTGVDDALVDPTAWTQIEALSVRKGLWHFLHWRTTATSVMDIPLLSPAWEVAAPRRLATTYTPAGSLSEQLRAIADRIFMRAICDRYGRLYCDVDPQITDVTNRTFPDVYPAEIQDEDWRDDITIERRIVSAASLVDVSGIYWSGTIATSSALFAISPGHYYKHYGRPEKRDRLSLLDQAQCNDLAGLYAGWLNNEFPNTDIGFSYNLRAIDIAPSMFLTLSIAAGDTPREITWASKRMIPRRVSFERDSGEAVMLTSGTFEAETTAETAMIGDPPLTPPDPPPPPDPPIPPDPPLPTEAELIVVMNKTQIGRSFNFFEASPVWENMLVGALTTAGDLRNICINSVGQAWVTAANGWYYCANIAAIGATWTQVVSIAAARAFTDVGTGEFYGCVVNKVTDVGCAVLCNALSDADDKLHWWFDATHTAVSCPIPPYLSAGALGPYPPYNLFVVGAAPGTVITGLEGIFDGGCGYQNAPAGTGDKVSVPYANRQMQVISTGDPGGTYGVNNSNLLVALSSLEVTVKSGVKYIRPVIEIATGHLLWTKEGAIGVGKDYDLMIDAIVQAIPWTTGGVTGVFGSGVTQAVGGAYIFVDTYDHILWVARTEAAINDYRSIAYTEDGGVNWQTKDGNWTAAIGAYAGSDAANCPVVARYSYSA
jgi:hypothetical protein